MHEVLVNRLGGLSLPRKSVVRLTDRPDMTLTVYRRRKTAKQQQYNKSMFIRQFNDLFCYQAKNNMALLYIFPSFTFLSFTFLFTVFCFSNLGKRIVLLNFLDTKVNPNSLLFSTERERERGRQTDREIERERLRERERERVAKVQS